MANAICYARQSFGSEVESTSIDVQLQACRDWCNKRGIEVIGEYTDHNVSSELYPDCASGRDACRIDRGFARWRESQLTRGRSEYKEGLGRAFDQIEQGCDYLVVYTRNRLGRTADNSYLDRYLDSFLIEHRCSLAIAQTDTVLDFSDRFMALVMQLKDSLDYQGLKEKRLASIESVSKRINEYRKWSNAVGVVMDGQTVRFDPALSKIIRWIYEQMASGASYGAILDWLNFRHRELARGRQWYLSNIRAILSNLTYAGYMTNRDGVVGRANNIPEPIISFSLWQRANEMVQTKKTKAGKAKGSHHFLPLSGYLKCSCGRRLLMYLDRGKIAYRCVNGKTHTCNIYINDDALLTIQQIFVLSVIDSRMRLEESKAMSDRVDGLKVSLERMQTALRAKFRLVQTDEDAELYKPEIDALKTQIRDTQMELVDAQAMDGSEQERLKQELETDFCAIMERVLLPEQDYMRLLQATVREITVLDDRIDIHTARGLTISIPRLVGKHNAKRLMRCTLLCDSAGEDVTDIMHYQIHLYDGEPVLTGGRTVFENEQVSVIVH